MSSSMPLRLRALARIAHVVLMMVGDDLASPTPLSIASSPSDGCRRGGQ